MKKILVLGAGQSTSFLIPYLLEQAEEKNWFITVGDRILHQAQARLDNHPCGSAIAFDVNDSEMRAEQIRKADLVVNMLPPAYQQIVANDCIMGHSHMVSASYEDFQLRDLDRDANRRGVLLLTEMGLDPGIDHMAAMELIGSVRGRGGKLTAFRSYGAGLPAPEFDANPLRYAITWNPRNVVMQGEAGATYLIDGKVKMVPHHDIFQRTWSVDIDGIGTLEAYPNRDSLYYKTLYGLYGVKTMVRGTLRYPGWCESWSPIVRLGLPNESMRIPQNSSVTYRDLTEMFVPTHVGGGEIQERIAHFLGISPTGKIMDDLRWLGLFSDEIVPHEMTTSSQAIAHLLVEKLVLGRQDRDMVIVAHVLDAEFPDEEHKRQQVTSTMIEYGTPGGITAMSRTVGLPTGIAARLILTGELPITGCQIATHPTVRTRVMKGLRAAGLKFVEQSRPLD